MSPRFHAGNAVGIDDALIVEGNIRIAGGARTAGDDEMSGSENGLVGIGLHFNRMGVDKLCSPLKDLNAISFESTSW